MELFYNINLQLSLFFPFSNSRKDLTIQNSYFSVLSFISDFIAFTMSFAIRAVMLRFFSIAWQKLHYLQNQWFHLNSYFHLTTWSNEKKPVLISVNQCHKTNRQHNAVTWIEWNNLSEKRAQFFIPKHTFSCIISNKRCSNFWICSWSCLLSLDMNDTALFFTVSSSRYSRQIGLNMPMVLDFQWIKFQ